jgi:FixJ family two-component response regulator
MSNPIPIRVAVVDDDEGACRSLSRLLRAGGMGSITYSSAEAFLGDDKHPKFDCLVLDIQLGGMTGIELQRQRLTAGDKTPVIFITGHDDPEARAEAEAQGCAAFFRKNDSGGDVLQAIRALAPSNRTPGDFQTTSNLEKQPT